MKSVFSSREPVPPLTQRPGLARSLTRSGLISVCGAGGFVGPTSICQPANQTVTFFNRGKDINKGLGFWTGVSHFKKPASSKVKKYANQIKLEVI